MIGEALRTVRSRVVIGVFGLLGALAEIRPASAQTVLVDCARLDRAARDELRARMRLALRSTRGTAAPFSVKLWCSAHDATLIWEAAFRERIPIDEQNGLVEGTLDAIERRLAGDSPPITRRPRASRPPPQPPRPAPVARRGGVGIGLALEASPITFGPRLDFGIPIGPLTLVGAQSLRAAPESTLLVSGEGGLGFGAPYDSTLPLGIVATIGVDALSSSRADGGPSPGGWGYATFASVGGRAALSSDRTTFFFGVDLRRRFDSLTTHRPEVTLAETGVLFSIGASFGLDLSDRRRR